MTDVDRTPGPGDDHAGDDAIRAVVTRLARPHASGGSVVERAALLAEGTDFTAVMAWITAHGGTPEAVGSVAHGGGLHSARTTADGRPARRFVLPPDALR